MNKLYTCNYATIRFLPYPETEEFVNIGVVLMCARLGYFGFRLETRRRDRVTGFFPEIDPQLFTFGRKEMSKELARIAQLFKRDGLAGQPLLDTGTGLFKEVFADLTRPRETVFRFGTVGTAMAGDPEAELERLFLDLVERQFAQHTDYQERVMTQRLASTLEKYQVVGYKQESLGDEDYRVTMPFVRGKTDRPAAVKAIKPLDLNKRDTTRIIEHGERWILRVKRLADMNYDPAAFLFPVRMPGDLKKAKYARELRDELAATNARVVDPGEETRIVAFAKE